MPLTQPDGQGNTESNSLGSKWAASCVPETTVGSVLHGFVDYDVLAKRPFPRTRIYVASVALTYAPLLFTAIISPLSLWTPTAELHLPFLRDWNIAFAFLVSFPTLVVLLATDDHEFRGSLGLIRSQGVICINAFDLSKITESWESRFRTVNVLAQSIGVGIGLALAWMTLKLYLPPTVGFWIATKGRLLPVGYAYWYCITLLYALITNYVVRCITFTVFLNKLVDLSTIHLLPFHPDKCGGLRPIGRLGLRNQYTLTILGLNVVILALVSLHSLPKLPFLIMTSAAAYLILGPIVFMGPLLPFRRGMLRTKADWMGEVAKRLRVEFERLRVQIQTGQISKEDEDFVDRLRKIGSVIDEFPVWPLDARTLRKFASAYVVPLISLCFSVVGKYFMAIMAHWLNV
jgi:hypothetical protein